MPDFSQLAGMLGGMGGGGGGGGNPLAALFQNPQMMQMYVLPPTHPPTHHPNPYSSAAHSNRLDFLYLPIQTTHPLSFSPYSTTTHLLTGPRP